MVIPQRGAASERVRCPDCYMMQADNKTWLPEPERKLEAIMRYIDDWFADPPRVFDEVLTHRAEVEKEAKARREELRQNDPSARRRALWEHG